MAELTGREIFAFGLGCLVALAGFNTGVAQARMVPSGSMAPTLQAGDRLLVTPLHLKGAPVRRGEIVIFKPPFSGLPGEADPAHGFWTVGDDQTYVKRVIGLPGETVAVEAGVGVRVNGQLLHEPYILAKPRYNWGPERVPEGKLFMLGDNRNESFDSHYWGFLPKENVVGRPAAIFWPQHRWKRF